MKGWWRKIPYLYRNIGSEMEKGGSVTAADVVTFTVEEDDGTLEAESETVTLRKTGDL